MKVCDKLFFPVSIFILLFFACGNDADGTYSYGVSLEDWNGKTLSVQLDQKAPAFELADDVRSLNITSSQDMDLFMAKMNVSSVVVPAVSSQFVVSAEQLESAQAKSVLPDVSQGEIPDSVPVRQDFKPARDFVPPYFSPSDEASGGTAENASGSLSGVTQLNPKVGTSQKDLWVELSTHVSGDYSAVKTLEGLEYTRRKATLRALGKYCYVWVLDDYFSEAKSDAPYNVSSVTAQRLADKFDEIYLLVRAVFGNESDTMINAGNFGTDFPPIATVSDTGSLVNIVIYDIEGDSAYSSGGGTYGYFWAKDYYTAAYAALAGTRNRAVQLTNQGKFFYLDSYFVNTDLDSIYSTLAHEFQHMINFGTKTLASMRSAGANGTVIHASTWYNEMLSMLCEDMMEEKLNLDDSSSPKSRLPLFCSAYYQSGVQDWLAGRDVLKSYASAYAFGAYLARNFGGAKLIKEIAQNSAVDSKSVTQALKKTGLNEDFESVFTKYAQALLLQGDVSETKASVTFNRDADESVFKDGYSFPMKAIDLFSFGTFSGTAGPVMLSPKKNRRVDLRPYGFTLHNLGTIAKGDTVRISFSSPQADSEKLYILAQPAGE